MNDKQNYIELLKPHLYGDRLEVALFLNDVLFKVDEFTKTDRAAESVQLFNDAVTLESKGGIQYLLLQGVAAHNLISGRRISSQRVRLNCTSKIEVCVGEVALIIHFNKTIRTKKIKKTLPIGIYFILSLLLQIWALKYCFTVLAAESEIGWYDCILFDNEERIFRIPDFSPETRLGRGRGLSTKDLGTVQTQSPYRDLKSDLSASVKTIRVSGALTHRDIARVFTAYKEPLDACKNRFPDLSHTLLFTIEPSKNIKPTSKITAFSKCAFHTIYKMNFLSASDGKTVAVQIRL